MQCVDLGGRRIIKKKFFQAEDGIRDFCLSRGLGDVYKRQDVFNNNVSKVFQRYITQYPQLQFCLNAHDHRVSTDDLFDDGVIYYGSDCMKHRSYMLFTITPDNYTYELVNF